MLQYSPGLKYISRRLRREMAESEQALWQHLRRKLLLGVQFYRQKPIGNYVVDFYAPKARLVIEVGGSQHLDAIHTQNDAYRDECLTSQGLKVLRFTNLQVLQERDAVLEVIFRTVKERLKQEEQPKQEEQLKQEEELKQEEQLKQNVSSSPPFAKGD